MTTRSPASADTPVSYPAQEHGDPELARLRARQANVWYILALIAALEILAGGWLISTLTRVSQ